MNQHKLFSLLKLKFCLFFVFGAAQLLAQGKIKGAVTLKEDDQILPAELTNIAVTGENNFFTGSTTDIEGIYELELPAGSYKIEFSYTGKPSKIEEVTLADGEEKELNVLIEEGTMLEMVVKTESRAEKTIAEATISIVTVDPKLAERAGQTSVSGIVDKVPGVTVVDGQANIRGGSGYSYGAGSRVLLLVDDMPFLQADAGFPNWRDMPIENLSGIEVLKGAGSALYGSSALNGIIHIRTAYATSEPYTKLALLATGYATPRRENTAWWKYDSLPTHDDKYNSDDTTTVANGAFVRPELLKGRAGYRKPVELNLQFAHRRKFGEKIFWTVGANGYYNDSYRAGEYDRKLRINSNLEYRLNKRAKLGLNVNFNTGSGGGFFLWGNTFFLSSVVDTAIYTPLAGTVNESKTNRFNIDPIFTYFDSLGGRHRVQGRYYSVSNNITANQSNGSDLLYLEYQYGKTLRKLANTQIVSGAVGQTTFASSQLFGNASYRISNVAAYLQVEKGFLPDKNDKNRLTIAGGARLEYNSIISPDSVLVSTIQPKILNPDPNSQEVRPVFRLGANYRQGKATFFRASWGQGYRYPTIAERYITTFVGSGLGSLEVRANPNLKSETGWSAEFGIMQGFKIPGTKWEGFLDVALFWTQYNDMMEFTFRGGDTNRVQGSPINGLYFSSVNIGNTRMQGGELSLFGRGEIAGTKVNIMAGYTLIDPKFRDFSPLQQKLSSEPDQNILKYRNRHTFKSDIEAFFLANDALSAGVSLNYVSAMQAIDGAFENLNLTGSTSFGNLPIDFFGIGRYRDSVNQGQYLNLSLRAGYKYSIMEKNETPNQPAKEKMSFKFSIIGQNMLNQEYMIRPALAAAPRNIMFRFDIDF